MSKNQVEPMTCEPVTVPSGQKVFSAALEVGLVRQVVDAGNGVHVSIQDRGDILAKAYSLGISLMGTSIGLLDFGLRSFEKTRTIQILVWDKWVDLDDVIAEKVHSGIQRFPVVKKDSNDLVNELCKCIEATGVWTATAKIKETYVLVCSVCKKLYVKTNDCWTQVNKALAGKSESKSEEKTRLESDSHIRYSYYR